MDQTSIPALGGITPRPFQSGAAAQQKINRIAVCIFLYIVLVMFPAYTLIRWAWDSDYPLFSVENIIWALVTGVLFALFARRSISARVVKSVETD